MGSLGRAVKSLLRWAKVTRAGTDDGSFPVQQVTYMGKVGDAAVWLPYGFHANCPPEELALILSAHGNGEARIMVPGSPTKRPRPIAASEVVVYHPPSGSKIHFKANGDVELDVKGDLSATVSGDATVVASGTAVVDGSTVELGGIGGPAVARIGDSVAGGVIVTGSSKVNAT